MGLRETKKLRTRQEIADKAMGLFVKRGFDHVTVAEVAAAADVSEKTVYNYFPTKEDLFYDEVPEREQALVEAIKNRRPGESVATALGRLQTAERGRLCSSAPSKAFGSASRDGGSSARSRAGLAATARGSATRACSPLESRETCCPARCSSPTAFSASSAGAWRSSAGRPRRASPSSTFSCAPRNGTRPDCWVTTPTEAARRRARAVRSSPESSRPRTTTSPLVCTARPATRRRSVVLPEPEGPVATLTRPAAQRASSPSRTTVAP